MNAAHLHIILVHIPVVLVPFGLALLATGIIRSNKTIIQVAHSTLCFAALFAIPAFLLGGEAEEVVEHLAGFSKKLIEEHEEAADFALWSCVILGILSLSALVSYARSSAKSRLLSQATLLLSLIVTGILTNTAQKGGMIRHPEAFQNNQTIEAEEHEEK